MASEQNEQEWEGVCNVNHSEHTSEFVKASRYCCSDADLVSKRSANLEKENDSSAGVESTPPWLMIVFALILFWGGAYLFAYSGGFHADVFDEDKVAWGVVKGDAVNAAVDPLVPGKRLYTANCAACHQASGEGMPGQYPPLAGSEITLGQGGYGQNHLAKIVLNGLAGPIHVKGAAYNGSMPPWKDVLTDEQIAHILTYVRQSWGNSAPAISKEGVAAMRTESGSRSQPWTEAALRAIPSADLPAPSSVPAPAASANPEAPGAPAVKPTPAKPADSKTSRTETTSLSSN